MNPFVEWNDNSKEAVVDAEGVDAKSGRKQDGGRRRTRKHSPLGKFRVAALRENVGFTEFKVRNQARSKQGPHKPHILTEMVSFFLNQSISLTFVCLFDIRSSFYKYILY